MKDLKNLTIALAFILLLIPFTNFTFSQTVKVKVTLKMDRITPQEQEILQQLPRELEDYANNYEWSDENKEILINISMNIIIETVSTGGVGAGKRYRGQLLVSSPSGENYYDKTCEFFYQQGLPLEHDLPVFNPLLGLFDYYVYMVLAGEMDTWILKGGTPFYDKARNIANQGLISDYSTGWKSRWDAVQLITDGDHIPLREAKLDYYDCLYYLEAKKDREKVLSLSNKVIELLEKVHNLRPNSTALKRFFDAHYTELCSIFSFDTDRLYVDRLIQMDPRHTETYQNCTSAF
ncbi:MAG: DUF4835 family protein [Calditrichia bacterium]